MSHGYGFLTESTIIPKKSKEIKINDNSGQILLQSIIQKQKQRLKNKQKTHIKPIDKQPKRNPGIEQRMKKDDQQQEKVKLTQKNIYKILEKKAELYDKMSNKKINVDKLLVDFQSKQSKASNQEQDQYQKAREAFYRGEIKNIQSQQKVLHDNVQVQNSSTSMARQRLTWAKQMLNQMNGIEVQIEKPKVAQSFDQKLSKEEHEAFEKVLNQEERQRNMIEAIKRRKQILEQERVRKLRKLNIIRDVGQASTALRKQAQQKQKDVQKQQKQTIIVKTSHEQVKKSQ